MSVMSGAARLSRAVLAVWPECLGYLATSGEI